MKAERDTVAAERSAQGQRMADQIRSNADRDSRVVQAQAKVEAADIEAKSRITAAAIYDDKKGKARVTGPVDFAIDGKEETA